MSAAIDYRVSWPRPATPCDLVPVWKGEFRSFNDWVSFATTRLTGTTDKLMGSELKAICIDAKGRRCTMGGHFMRARDEDAFPVRYFWECEPQPAAEAPLSKPLAWSVKKLAPGCYAVEEGTRGYRIGVFKTERDAQRMVNASQYRIEVVA